jgi:cell division protease FtsH
MLDNGLSMDDVAAITPGFTGADLANLCNEAALIATRRGGSTVGMDDFVAAVERIVAGAERRSRLVQPEERRRIAVHELGHAIVAASVPTADPVQKVSIIPRSIGALGYTLQRPTEDRYVITSGELKDRMAVLMGGRAAELLVFGDYSTGAADDLAKATDIARQYAARFGMSDTIGHAVLEQIVQPYLQVPFARESRDYSEATARELDLAVRTSMQESIERASTILKGKLDELRRGADLLLDREVLTPADLPVLERSKEQPVHEPLRA